MNRRKWMAIGVSVLMAIVLLSGLALIAEAEGTFTIIGLQRRYEIERTVRLEGDTLSVRNGLGAVRVRGGGEPGEVQVRGSAYLWAWGSSGEEAENALSVTSNPDGTQIEAPDKTLIIGPFISGTVIDLELVVPDGVKLQVRTSLGAVALSDVNVDVKVSTGMGSITVDGFKGSLEAESQMGKVTVRRAEMTGRLSLASALNSVRFEGIPAEESAIVTQLASSYLYLPPDQAYSLKNSHGEPLQSLSSEMPFKDGIVGVGTLRGNITVSTGMGSLYIFRR